MNHMGDIMVFLLDKVAFKGAAIRGDQTQWPTVKMTPD
jgi:pantothenate kinase-related protein Tda10